MFSKGLLGLYHYEDKFNSPVQQFGPRITVLHDPVEAWLVAVLAYVATQEAGFEAFFGHDGTYGNKFRSPAMTTKKKAADLAWRYFVRCSIPLHMSQP